LTAVPFPATVVAGKGTPTIQTKNQQLLKGTLQMKFTYDSDKPISRTDVEHFAAIVEPNFFELFLRTYARNQLSVLLSKPEINEYSVSCTYEHDKNGGKWRARGMQNKMNGSRVAEGDILEKCVEQVTLFLKLESSNKLQLLEAPKKEEEETSDEIPF